MTTCGNRLTDDGWHGFCQRPPHDDEFHKGRCTRSGRRLCEIDLLVWSHDTDSGKACWDSADPDPIWNVTASVVDLIPAATADEAVDKLIARLTAAGFDYLEDPPGDAFESEPLSDDVEAKARSEWERF